MTNLQVGDKVYIDGLPETNPWQGLTGEIIWIDPDDSDAEFQTISVRVNFPTPDGTKEVNQNFDRMNVKKEGAAEEVVEENLNEAEGAKIDLESAIKDSYDFLSGKLYAEDRLPTAEEVAEDIVDNYDGYKDLVDLSSPEKYNSWVSEVKQELNRLGLEFEDEK